MGKAQQRQRDGKKPYSDRLLYFEDSDIEPTVLLFDKYVRERSRAFELSFLRIIGIVSALRPFCERDSTGSPTAWWLSSGEYAESVDTLRNFVEALGPIYTETQLDEFKRRVFDIDTRPVEHYLRSLPDIVARHRLNTPLPKDDLHRAAEKYVQAEFGTGPLTCLGIGEEGVVLTDGRLVYKYFHYWKIRDKDRRIAFLRSLVGKLSGYRTLLDIREVHSRGDHVVAIYPYDPGTKYEGGHLDEVLTLLRECRDAGIACRNVHPDNLLVTPSGLKLIDYGSDIVSASDDEFEQMCRRAYLSCYFHFR